MLMPRLCSTTIKAVLFTATLILSACGGGSDSPPPAPSAPAPAPAPASAVIGPAGGSLRSPDGVELIVPPGALTEQVTVRIARSSTGAPPLPPGIRSDVPIYEITPHDLEFLQPVQVRVPLDGPAPELPAVLVASPTQQWMTNLSRIEGQTVIVERPRLSWYCVGCFFPGGCSDPDPERLQCIPATVFPNVAVVPASALQRGQPLGPGGGFQSVIASAATLNLNIDYAAPRDCVTSPRMVVTRTGPTWGSNPTRVTVFDGSVVMARGPGPSQNLLLRSASQAGGTLPLAVPIDASLNGEIRFAIEFECRASGNRLLRAGQYGQYSVNIPPAAPPVVSAPSSPTVVSGQPATFSVTATVTPAAPLTFQWSRRAAGASAFAPVTGATSAAFTLPRAALADNGAQFRVEVCAGTVCTTSSAATLTVNPAAPQIVLLPTGNNVPAGSSATFGAQLQNAADALDQPLSWRWTFRGSVILQAGTYNQGGCSATITFAAGGSAITLSNLTAGCNNSTVVAEAINRAGTGQSTAQLNVGTSGILFASRIAGAVINEGGSAQFGFSLQQVPSGVSYLWRFNGVDIPSGGSTQGVCGATATVGAGGTSLLLTNVPVQCTNSVIEIIVTDSFGNLARDSATLFVLPAGPPPTTVAWQADQLIGGGGTHTLVVRSNGQLWSWGTNNGGALGRANGDSVTAPSHVTTLGSTVRSVAAGAWYSVALRNDGTVWAWGDGDRVGAAVGAAGAIQLPLQAGGLSNIRAISTRYWHTLALRDDGTVWGFGPETFSALGPSTGNGAARQIPGLSDVRQVAAGEQHSVALLADGTVRTWGSNSLSQLGVNTGGAPRTAPQTVPITDVVAIAASSFASFALRSDGTLWRWGHFAGATQAAPTQMTVSGTISALATGNQTLHVLRSDGTVLGAGDNTFGRVGVGLPGGTVTTLSALGNFGGTVAALGGGEFHAMAIRSDGRVFAWGSNGLGQVNGTAGANETAPLDTGFTR
jgi:alpha-tubulin suppressor-like RCC1 family protein